MSEQQNNSPRQAAVNALISWAKTGWGLLLHEKCGKLFIL